MPLCTYTHPRTGRAVRTRLDLVRLGRAVRAYEDGLGVHHACELAGCSSTALHNILVKLGLNRSNAEAQRLLYHTDEKAERAVVLYQAGLSIRAVAEILDTSHARVIGWLNAAGVPRRPKRQAHQLTRRVRLAQQKALRACRMRAAGVPRRRVAKELGVSETMVSVYWGRDDNPYRN